MMFTNKTKADELQKCPVCGSSLAYPVDRYQINDLEWRVEMFCPNCSCKRELLADREMVRELLKNARIGREFLAKQADDMKKKNMEEEVEKLISAINKDQLLPIDF